ncbi:MAG: hypothetical protein N2109_11875 [Fimbriimonadales bacterium]|nr:hypothetical protein [Fimbriimonadales bacterium]
MDRRCFLRACAAVGFGMALPPGAAASAAPGRPQRQNRMGRRKLYIWSGIDRNASEKDLKARYGLLKRRGLDGAFVSGGLDDREFDVMKTLGLEVHTWMWTTNRGDRWIRENHPDWYMVSRTGKSCFDQPPYVDYYRWVSPVVPGVRRYLVERVGELAAHPAVDGVHLDYVRYPDVILPKALWRTYGLNQSEELPDYDFCYSEHTRRAFREYDGRDPLEIADPAHDQAWLHFRYDSVTRLVEDLAREARRHGKRITAAVFPTPDLARKICRQDWDKWPLDAVCPMIYHSFYDEGIEWIGESVLEDIRAVNRPVVAGLYMPAFRSLSEFEQGVRLAMRRGASGVSLFGEVTDSHWEVAARVRDEFGS